MKDRARWWLLLFGVAGLVLGGAALVWACTPSVSGTYDPETMEPVNSGPPGTTVVISGSTPQEEREIVIRLAQTDDASAWIAELGRTMPFTDEENRGKFAATITIPESVAPGQYGIWPVHVNPDAWEGGAVFTVTAPEPSDPGNDPGTGGGGPNTGGNPGTNTGGNPGTNTGGNPGTNVDRVNENQTGNAPAPGRNDQPAPTTGTARSSAQQPGTSVANPEEASTTITAMRVRRAEPAQPSRSGKVDAEPAVTGPSLASSSGSEAVQLPALGTGPGVEEGRNAYLTAGAAVFGIGLVLLLAGFVVMELRRGRSVARPRRDDRPRSEA